MKGYDYFYEHDPWYCYPGSDVLRNKLEITDGELLDKKEASITAIRMMELDSDPVVGNFDLDHLRSIHRRIFSDVYEWAGDLRTVDISKGNPFCPCQYIEPQASELFRRLHEDNLLRELDEDTFVEKVAYYLGEINVIHPFREGNGRAQRKFIEQLSQQAGHPISFKLIGKDEMIVACDHAFRGRYGLLNTLVRRCLLSPDGLDVPEGASRYEFRELCSRAALKTFSIELSRERRIDENVADYFNEDLGIIVELRHGFTDRDDHGNASVRQRMVVDVRSALETMGAMVPKLSPTVSVSYIVYVLDVSSYMSLGTEGTANILSKLDFSIYGVAAIAICLIPTRLGPNMYSGTEVYYQDLGAIDKKIFSKDTEFVRIARPNQK